jgi:hypothetical protein
MRVADVCTSSTGLADRSVGFHRLASRLLDGADLGGDVVGGARRLAGQRLHFLRDDGEAAAGIACAGRFDRGVQCEQVGLPGNVADEAEDRFDRLDMAGKRLADADGLAGLIAGAGRDSGGDFDLGTGILDRADEAGGGVGRLAHCNGRLLGSGRDFGRLAQHAADGRRGMGSLIAEPAAFGRGSFDPAQHLAIELDSAGGPAVPLPADPDRLVMRGVDVELEERGLHQSLDETVEALGIVGECRDEQVVRFGRGCTEA